jgi:hypothetical protein
MRVGALALALAVFALPLVAEAQQGGKHFRDWAFIRSRVRARARGRYR